jgi:hypothetical protein
MKTHQEIDRRSLVMAGRIVSLIDADPDRKGLLKARDVCARWYRENPVPAIGEWMKILQDDWSIVRIVLLDDSEEGRRLRQSNPFCGVLSPRDRWEIYREFSHEPEAA